MANQKLDGQEIGEQGHGQTTILYGYALKVNYKFNVKFRRGVMVKRMDYDYIMKSLKTAPSDEYQKISIGLLQDNSTNQMTLMQLQYPLGVNKTFEYDF